MRFTPRSLSPWGEQPRIATEKEVTWVPETIPILWRREKSPSPAQN